MAARGRKNEAVNVVELYAMMGHRNGAKPGKNGERSTVEIKINSCIFSTGRLFYAPELPELALESTEPKVCYKLKFRIFKRITQAIKTANQFNKLTEPVERTVPVEKRMR